MRIPQPAGVIRADPQRCHGCGICELACSLSHDGACGPTASSIRVLRDPLAGAVTLETCRQCSAPDCYFACPVDAIAIDDRTGARRIVDEKCVSCGNCATACPFNDEAYIVKPSPTRTSYVKCDLCSNRGRPLCVDACPWEALRYVAASER